MALQDIEAPSRAAMQGASGIARAAERDWPRYIEDSTRRAGFIDRLLTRFRPDLPAGTRVLDWGGGLGGTAVTLATMRPVEMHSADVDAPAVTWLRDSDADVTAHQLEPGQRLPFEDGMFDVIYGISVLTHIPEALQDFYLGELYRVCRSDGLVLLSIRGRRALEHAWKTGQNPHLQPESLDALEAAGLYYRPYPDHVLDKIDFAEGGDDWGLAYHADSYIDRVFGRWFEIERVPEVRAGPQDFLALHPRRTPGA